MIVAQYVEVKGSALLTFGFCDGQFFKRLECIERSTSNSAPFITAQFSKTSIPQALSFVFKYLVACRILGSDN